MPSITTIIISAIFILPFVVGICFSIFFYMRSMKGRRTPLTGQLLRGPGESLRTQLDENFDKIPNAFISLFLVAIPAYALLVVLINISNKGIGFWQLALVLLVYVGLTIWATRRLYNIMIRSRNLRLGLDGELAVGQELNHLMLHGCRVFHDFPAEEFNIDHVVVGPAGVFAVETKARAKPDKGRGNVDAKVFYDGEILKFPDWHETKPLDQAKRQSIWLSKWLSSAIGEQVTSFPVLALPGWFVERTKMGGVLVINGKSPFVLARPQGKTTLDEKLIQQIAHQLEQRCRDVKPVAYRKLR